MLSCTEYNEQANFSMELVAPTSDSDLAKNIPSIDSNNEKSSELGEKVEIEEERVDLNNPIEIQIIPPRPEIESQIILEPPQTSQSIGVQTNVQDFELSAIPPKINIPLSIVTLQSILVSARAKSASKISPKQFTVYQISNEILLFLQESLKYQKNAYNFIGQPVTSITGHEIDRMGWWFSVIQNLMSNLAPSPGSILPSMKMLRTEISALADLALQVLNVQKKLEKQIQKMAGGLESIFKRYENIFGTKLWHEKLIEMRHQDCDLLKKKFEKWLQKSQCLNVTKFETKTLIIQHSTNKELKCLSLNKLSLKCRKEFIKNCLNHLQTILRKSCTDSERAHEELKKVDKDVKLSIDKLVRKLENLRRNHRFRETNCDLLLKKSLHSLGLCLYEFIDIVRFIIKLARFVLLASEHVLRFAHGRSNFCDVTYLSQLNVILEEFEDKEKHFLVCFKRKKKRLEERREIILTTFEQYFQQWITSNITTVQVPLPVTTEMTNLIFNEEKEGISLNTGQRSEGVMAETEIISLRDLKSSNELDVEILAKINQPSIISVIETDLSLSTAHKLEEIGFKLNPPAGSSDFQDKKLVDSQRDLVDVEHLQS